MAFGRKQRRIEALQRRVSELEERLCPCEEHDWKNIATDYEYDTGGGVEARYKYKCRRCGKTKWDWK